MNDNQQLMAIFFDIQRGLPRQGPGLNVMTLEALSYCRQLPAEIDVLDIGCGPGMQTLALAGALNGHITAIDLHEEYLDQLAADAREVSLAHKISVSQEDMATLPYDDATFDLIWAEGSAYSMGFAAALTSWKPLLKAGGYLMVSELTWLEREPPSEVQAFFDREYPAMQHVDDAVKTVKEAGYTLIKTLILPDSGWWTHYYTPLSEKLPSLKKKYADNANGLGLLVATETEIEMRRTYPATYGYVYFVTQTP